MVSERITVTAELLLNGEVWQVEQAQVRVRAPDSPNQQR
jgi:hypothetical protein